MPYYKDAQPMYAQQNSQRVTPLQETYTPPQYFQTSQTSDPDSIKEFFTKYWWILVLVLIVLVFAIYMWYYGRKSEERTIEF